MKEDKGLFGPIAIILLSAVVYLGVVGVIVWAVIRIVLKFT